VGKPGDDVCSDVYTCIEAGVQQKRHVQIHYYTKTREEWTDRVIEPYVIVYRGNAWYLVAYCHLNLEVRIFRLDRIDRATLMTEPFELPRNFSADSFFAGSWVIEQGDPVRIKLRFAPEAARWVRVAKYHPTQELEEQPDGSLLFIGTVTGTREITRWILGYGADVEVLEPRELRSEVRAEVTRMTGIYRCISEGV